MKLSILICCKIDRFIKMSKPLYEKLSWQVLEAGIDGEVIWDATENISIGTKRNNLLQRSKGEYICFVDDDDDVSTDYVKLLLEGINKGVDCCSLKGIYTVDGLMDGLFEHSLKYQEWKTNSDIQSATHIKYERYPNHLNCIKSSIAKQFKFPEKNFGEDHDWSKRLHESGLLKTEHYIEQPIYFYKYITKK